MGLLTLVEDRPTPSAVYNWRVYACAGVASFASCMIGYESAFFGTTIALESFEEEFGFNEMSESHLNFIKANIVSIYQAGAFFGALFAYASAYWLGRKFSLILWSLLFLLGAGMMLGANGDRGLDLIYAGRVIAGIGVGATSNVVPIYISELSPPAVRGRLVGLYELGWQVGGLVGFWINYGLTEHMEPSHQQWIIPFAVQLIPGGMLFLGAFWLKESPRWLVSKNRREQAIKNLCWIRNLREDEIYIVEEVAFIDAAIEEQNAAIGVGFWKPFKAVGQNKKVQWRFVLGCMLFLFQNGSGINASPKSRINYYSPTVFKSIGISGGNTAFLTTGIFGVVKTVLTFVWLFYLIDRLGRRNLLMIGAGGGSICMWIIGTWIYQCKPYRQHGGELIVVFWREMFDQQVRSLGQASAAASNWFWNFIIARFTPQMFANMGPSGCGVYYFFASMMILSIIWVYFVMPETKGIPLESMNRLFEIMPARKAHRTVHAEDEAREADFRQDAEGAGLSISKERFDHVEKTTEQA
ncbi:putative quinate [Hortaea werneckii]|nr:putative quinate [Hortaea werneckii]